MLHMTPLERITARVCLNGHPDDVETPRPLLSLSEFFDGNDVVGSIGCNLVPIPEPATLRMLFETVLGRPDVAERVQITAFDDPDWPFSDVVWLITSASPETVAKWFPEDLAPDDVSVGWTDGVLLEPCEVPDGMRPLACWWD